MNINLVYKDSEYNFDMLKTTPLSYLYKISEEKFKLQQNHIELYFEDRCIPNKNKATNDFFGSTKKCQIKILYKNNSPNSTLTNEKSKKNENKISDILKVKSTFLPTLPKLSLKKKKKKPKKHFITCQLCKQKDAIFYCRNCNQFLCLECNIKYPVHYEHQIINLENGNLKANVDVYRKLIIDDLNIVKTAFISSSEWIIDDQIRFDYFQNLVELIREIDQKSSELTSSKTSYNVELNLLNDLRKELFDIEPPNFKDETIDIFSEINEKEKTLNNFAVFVNLQVLKSQFNKKMIELFEIIQHNLQDILTDVNNKLKEVNQINDYGFKELKEYNDSLSEASTKADDNINSNYNTNNNQNLSFPNINNKNNNNNSINNNNSNIFIDSNISAFAERMAPLLSERNKKTFIEPYKLNKSFNYFHEFKHNNNYNISLRKQSDNNPLSIINHSLDKKNSEKNVHKDDLTMYSNSFINHGNNTINNGNMSYRKPVVSPSKLSDNSTRLKLFLSNQKKKIKKNDVIETGSILNIINSPVKNKKKIK